ncbi:MAG: LysM peptidoglycan-binding domain-containing protein, partial [Gammaproteobacteria bacterium]|nr:LysM peptidoglycan-binding domain-containing protein [Gammaproteobacteria bacterium]
ASNAIDGDPSTHWHSNWSTNSTPPPHELQIDLGETTTLTSFEYVPRQSGGWNGMIGDYEFYVSTDGVSWGSPVATGTFPGGPQSHLVEFSATEGSFVRLVALSEVNGNNWTSMSEFNLSHQTVSVSTSYYEVQTGDTWASIATLIYGDVEAAGALQTELGSPSLTQGVELTIPLSLSYSRNVSANSAQLIDTQEVNTPTDYTLDTAQLSNTITVPAYYEVQTGDTWASIATSLYGTADVADELQAALNNPTLTQGVQLTSLPTNLTHIETTQQAVTPYYEVQSGDTWESIANTVYGNSAAGTELANALNNPALTEGAHLEVPANLDYMHTGNADTSVLTGGQAAAPTTVNVIPSALSTGAVPYYEVQSSDGWAGIATALYGDGGAGPALQTALGNPTLTAGTQLIMPASLNYTPAPITVLHSDGSAFQAGVAYDYYDGRPAGGTVDGIPDLNPTLSGIAADFDVDALLLTLGESSDDLGFRYTGYIEITTAGTYTFNTNSDDGSKLYIDGLEIVDNDGYHPARTVSGNIELIAGIHAIEVEFFEGGSAEILEVHYSGADTGDVLVDLAGAGVLKVE